MDLRSVITVLLCDGLGDFPTHLTESESAAVLHNWTAAWRPELLAAAGGLPRVASAYSPPAVENIPQAAVILPALSETSETDAWRDSLSSTPDCAVQLLEGFEHRDEVIAELSRRGLELTDHGDRWAPEFYALGYAFVQAEMLTHSLTYGSIISLDELERRAVAAARAATVGDDQQVEDSLRGVYDLLEQVRDHSFAVQTSLIDLVLLGDSTLGDRLERELSESSPKSYLITPRTSDRLRQGDDHSAKRLGEQCLAAVCDARDLAALSPEGARRQVQAALDAVRELYPDGRPALVHTHGGVAPRLSSLVASCDAAGLLITPLDGAAPPAVDQSRFAWQNPDGDFTETLVAAPRDASKAAPLLGFASRLSESLFREHVSTEVFAAWAGCRHELFDDFRRVAARSNLLGKLVTIDQYLADTQGVAPTAVVSDDQVALRLGAVAADHSAEPANLAGLASYAAELAGLTDDAAQGQEPSDHARLIGSAVAAVKPERDPVDDARIVVNASAFRRTMLVGGGGQGGPCDLLTAEIVPGVPALGYRVIGGGPPPAVTDDAPPPRATHLGLQNELYQVLLDGESGGVRTLRTQSRRRNRLSQRLAVRRGPRRIDLPIRVELEEPTVLAADRDRGAVAVSGRLFDLKSGLLAKFEQRFYLLAGVARLYVDVTLDVTGATTTLDDLWFTSRVALPEADWRLHRGVQWTRLATHRAAFAASDYVHCANGQESVTLCGLGTTEHLWFGGRMLDSCLPRPVAGRSVCRLSFALDEPRPLRAALDLQAHLEVAAAAPCAAAVGESGWLVHQDCGNVQVSRVWRPAAGCLRLELVETEGRTADPRVQFAKRPREAYWLSPSGQRGGTLDRLGEAVAAPLNAYESRAIEITW